MHILLRDQMQGSIPADQYPSYGLQLWADQYPNSFQGQLPAYDDQLPADNAASLGSALNLICNMIS